MLLQKYWLLLADEGLELSFPPEFDNNNSIKMSLLSNDETLIQANTK